MQLYDKTGIKPCCCCSPAAKRLQHPFIDCHGMPHDTCLPMQGVCWSCNGSTVLKDASRKCNFINRLESSTQALMQLMLWRRELMYERDHLVHAALAASSLANICISFAGKGNAAQPHHRTFSCANRAVRCPGRSDHRADCSSLGEPPNVLRQDNASNSWSSRADGSSKQPLTGSSTLLLKSDPGPACCCCSPGAKRLQHPFMDCHGMPHDMCLPMHGVCWSCNCSTVLKDAMNKELRRALTSQQDAACTWHLSIWRLFWNVIQEPYENPQSFSPMFTFTCR